MTVDATNFKLYQNNNFGIDTKKENKPATDPFTFNNDGIFSVKDLNYSDYKLEKTEAQKPQDEEKSIIQSEKTEVQKPQDEKKSIIQQRKDKYAAMGEKEKEQYNNWMSYKTHEGLPRTGKITCHKEENNIPEKYKEAAQQMKAEYLNNPEKMKNFEKTIAEEPNFIDNIIFSRLARQDAKNVTKEQKALYDEENSKIINYMKESLTSTDEGKEALKYMPEFVTRSAEQLALQHMMKEVGGLDKNIEEVYTMTKALYTPEEQAKRDAILNASADDKKTTSYEELNANAFVGTDHEKMLATDHSFNGQPCLYNRLLGAKYKENKYEKHQTDQLLSIGNGGNHKGPSGSSGTEGPGGGGGDTPGGGGGDTPGGGGGDTPGGGGGDTPGGGGGNTPGGGCGPGGGGDNHGGAG